MCVHIYSRNCPEEHRDLEPCLPGYAAILIFDQVEDCDCSEDVLGGCFDGTKVQFFFGLSLHCIEAHLCCRVLSGSKARYTEHVSKAF